MTHGTPAEGVDAERVERVVVVVDGYERLLPLDDWFRGPLRERMHDYVHYMCPQFSRTHVNFQRVPVVDTSNPFIARWIPTPDESMVVIRLKNPRGIDFPYLLSMIPHSFMSRANSIMPGEMSVQVAWPMTPARRRLSEK